MEEHVGKICPFCKTEIQAGDAVIVCPECGIPHHEVCWKKNKGCTTFGCDQQHYEEQNLNPADVCVNCGAPFDDWYHFCPKCGTPRGKEKEHICRKCGAELQEDQNFCPKCGLQIMTPGTVRLSTEQPAEAESNTSQSKEDKPLPIQPFAKKKMSEKGLLAIVGVVALVVILSVATRGNRNSHTGSNNNSSGNSSSSTSYSSSSAQMDHALYCMLYMTVSDVKVKHERDYTYISGTITNDGTYQIKYVKVKAACKDRSGTVIDTDWTYAVDSSWLDPGESNTFEMMVRDEEGRIKDADVSVVRE